jgi:hypothetical protein
MASVRSYKDFQPLFDKKPTGPGIKKLLASLGCTKPVVLPKGRRRVDVRIASAGIILEFVTRSNIWTTDELRLFRVKLRPPFAGRLPKGLTWGDDRASVETKGGPLLRHRSGWFEPIRENGKRRWKTTDLAFRRQGRLSEVCLYR